MDYRRGVIKIEFLCPAEGALKRIHLTRLNIKLNGASLVDWLFLLLPQLVVEIITVFSLGGSSGEDKSHGRQRSTTDKNTKPKSQKETTKGVIISKLCASCVIN